MNAARVLARTTLIARIARRIVLLASAGVACGGGSTDSTSAPQEPTAPVPQPPAIAALQFDVQPATVYVGAPIAPVVQVLALLADGSPARQFTGAITLWIKDSVAGLEGVTTLGAAGGVARFRDVWVTRPGRYTLRATADGAVRESAAFDVLPLPRVAYNACFTWVDIIFDSVGGCTAAGVAVSSPPNVVASLSPFTDSFSWDPAWSPDGQYIAMVGTRGCRLWTSCTPDLFLVSVETRSETRITHGEFGTLATPAWSPDGRRLSFSAIRKDSVSAVPGIYTMTRDGSQITPLATLLGEGAVWSPDGTRIAFAAPYSGRNRAIWIANADGTGATQAVQTTLDDYAPAWSPDGRRIAFTRVWGAGSSDGELCQIFIADVSAASNASPTQLTFDPSCANRPAWSPDGRQLAYNGRDQALNRGVIIINADGSAPRLLRRNVWEVESRAAWPPLATPEFGRWQGLTPVIQIAK